MFVVVGEKFGFVGCNIDADRAVTLAALACQAEIERFLDVLVLPLPLNDIAFGHFPEQVSAAAGGMLLFAGGAKAGTHHATFVLAAFADSHATQAGAR